MHNISIFHWFYLFIYQGKTIAHTIFSGKGNRSSQRKPTQTNLKVKGQQKGPTGRGMNPCEAGVLHCVTISFIVCFKCNYYIKTLSI